MRRRVWLVALPGVWLAPGAGIRAASASEPAPAGHAMAPTAVAPSAVTAASGPPGQALDEAASAPARGVSHRPLHFPADHGVHPDTHVEWWYVTGWMRTAAATAARAPTSDSADGPPGFGFQATFFRNRTGLGEGSPSRFAAQQLVFAHAALTDLGADGAAPGQVHDQRAARLGFGLAELPAAEGTQTARLRDWSLRRAATASGAPSELRIAIKAEHFSFDLALASTQPLLLQGDAGYSRKSPDARAASHYYSEPQLALRGRVERGGAPAREVVGRAWLDHEWSNLYVPPDAMGWDWLGINLVDGGALMAFRLRRPDGSTLWAGGSFRPASGSTRIFGADEVSFHPLRRWTSPRTHTTYPVEWDLTTPAGRWRVAALLDDQELDSRASTGAVYWEGIAALQAQDGRALGWGYLELTGYLERLRM